MAGSTWTTEESILVSSALTTVLLLYGLRSTVDYLLNPGSVLRQDLLMMPTHVVSVEVSTLKWVGEPSSFFVSEVDLYYYWVGSQRRKSTTTGSTEYTNHLHAPPSHFGSL